ncbi:dihydropyrimidinase/allantoinase [Rhizobium sp. RU35A]|uniref:dihydroorotase n=1 Tax=Rhizobium sp. RU35A TaxID=1907414 RepID=UPI0009552493|nr:dihydroorotase family protein [Rhizobium sp. RU35A]SIQ46068.1 dihydropyrimidinase/allantoinase [Rhizobium sp. RU35A]
MTAAYETLIRNAHIVSSDGIAAADVALAYGKIAAMVAPGTPVAADHVIDATGLHLLPGVIDIHCHVRAPAFPERGSVESETRAAAAGGITTLFEMPISKPCCNSAERVMIRRDHFADRALVDFALYAAPGDLSAKALEASASAGAIAFKIFTTAAPPGRDDEFAGLSFPDEGSQLATLEALARTGLPVVVHAESEQLLAHYAAEAAGLDPSLATTHCALRPEICEAVAVAKLLLMNMQAGARLHIAHVTSALTVDVLRRFKGTSDFSAETCPHYLVRTVEDVQAAGVFAKINPPVRGKADQDALWAALADGTIDHVTTDHAAFALAEKQAHLGNFPKAPPGSPGLETMLPAMLDAVCRKRLDLPRMVALLSGNAARRFNLPDKGAIRVGADADLVLVDLKGRTRITPQTLFTHARDISHLYQNAEFEGAIRRTLVRGRTVFEDGKISTDPGWGRYTVPTGAMAARAVA